MGPPASGKSTLAKHLSAKTGAQIISTDEIRKNLYGDDSRQGDWDEVEEIMHEKIINSISSNQAVIVDATVLPLPVAASITPMRDPGSFDPRVFATVAIIFF